MDNGLSKLPPVKGDSLFHAVDIREDLLLLLMMEPLYLNFLNFLSSS